MAIIDLLNLIKKKVKVKVEEIFYLESCYNKNTFCFVDSKKKKERGKDTNYC